MGAEEQKKNMRIQGIMDSSADTAQDRAMPDTPLAVGQSIYVFKVNKAEYQADSVLLGFKYGEFLLFERPKIKDKPLSLQVGERFVMKFISKGKLVGFRSQLIATMGAQFNNRSFNLYYAAYPANVETLNIRSAERLDVFLPALVTFRGGVQSKALMLALSPKGGRFIVRPPYQLKKGAQLKASLMMPTSANVHNVHMVVKRVFKNPSGKIEIGTVFNFAKTEKGEEAEERIQQYLAMKDI